MTFSSPFPMLRGVSNVILKKVCSVAEFGCPIPCNASFLRKATILNKAACVQVRNYSFQCFLTCCFTHHHRAFLYDLHMCACCDCVLLIKMTCTVNWIIMRERCVVNLTLSSWPSWIQRQDSVKTSEAKPRCSGWPWLLLCLVMLSMLHNMLLHRHLGRWIKVMISSTPAVSCRSRLYITGTDKSRYASIVWSCRLQDGLLTRDWELHLPEILLHRFS